ncbi:MAG: AAA family ATPase [Anaerolineae bacterium]|nr:AAA family ATPase [Anaerolineae bacterium]
MLTNTSLPSLANYSGPEWPIVPPSQPPEDVWLDDDLRDTVVLHLVKNHLSGANPALMLAIQGRAGEGKTFQIRMICSAAGAYMIPVSGGSLSAGDGYSAADKIQSIYRFASALRESTGAMTAVVIDDFDLSVASAIGNSLDAQFMTGVLMNLADDPHHCGNARTHRIPMILSGNNFTFLHGPLTRHGRMTFFEWAPTSEQRKRIVRAMFTGLLTGEDLAGTDQLLHANRHQPLSFFAALKDDLVNQVLIGDMHQQGGIDLEHLNQVVANRRGTYRLATLFALAAQRSGAKGSTYL